MGRRFPGLGPLRTFEAVARHLSFTKAAEELHVTPGAVSVQIRAIEDRLQIRLFQRTSRSVQLTAAGARLMETAGAAESAMNAALETAQADRVSGAVRISAPKLCVRLTL